MRRRVLALALALASVVVPLGVGGDTAHGHALDLPSGFGIGHTRSVQPGQEQYVIPATIRNRSSTPVTLLDIAPLLGPGVGTVADFEFEVAPLDEPSPGLATSFLTDPPVGRPGPHTEKCTAWNLRSAPDTILEAGQLNDEGVALAVRIRARDPGRFRLPGVRVTYRIGARTVTQVAHFTVHGRVREGARPMTPDEDERECARELEAQVLGPV